MWSFQEINFDKKLIIIYNYELNWNSQMVLGSAASIFEIEIIINEDTNNCHDFGEYVCIDCIIKAYGMLFFLKCLNILIPKIEYKINLVGKF